MTNKPQIGCYGSAVFYSASAPECVACPVKESCSNLALAAQARAVETVKSLDCQFATDELSGVQARLAAARVVTVVDDTMRRAAQATLKDWEARGVNAYLIGHAIVPHGLDPVELVIVEAMIKSEKFSVQDIVSQTRGSGSSAAKLTAKTKEIIAALVEARVAVKNKRGVFSI